MPHEAAQHSPAKPHTDKLSSPRPRYAFHDEPAAFVMDIANAPFLRALGTGDLKPIGSVFVLDFLPSSCRRDPAESSYSKKSLNFNE
jgi:hypothetical protein